MPHEDMPEYPVMTEAVVQADIGGMTIAFTASVTGPELDQRLDAWRKAINRQRAQNELVEALVDVQARREALVSAPDREREAIRARLDERARLVASFEAAHQVHRPRAEFKMTDSQRGALETFDAETEQQKAKFAADREKVAADLPQFEARIERARRIIDGAERAEVIEGLRLAAE